MKWLNNKTPHGCIQAYKKLAENPPVIDHTQQRSFLSEKVRTLCNIQSKEHESDPQTLPMKMKQICEKVAQDGGVWKGRGPGLA